ncbi:MerR family transcriptional regulator [Priestia megaterium]|uniref:MerR family transcriptional regulator n=1 Tax=Priestia megaterium TaxID=1404 RepID=UPI002795A4C2|nr:MerR family transcriptional regulator [Priestia megaterium]
MKNKKIGLFVTLVVVILGVTFFNIYLDRNIQKTTTNENMRVENEQFKQENEDLKQRLKDVLPSAQEQKRTEYLSTVRQFIDVSYHREKDGFDKRKEIAKDIMSEELYEQFYPSEEFVYGNSYTSKPTDVQLYLQQYDNKKEEINVVAEFVNHLVIKDENVDEKTHDIVKITLKKYVNKWQVTSIEELKTEIEK